MEVTEPVVGVVLSGGRSSRMGGGDKCLLQLGGEPVLARILHRLRPQVIDIIINANGDLSRFAEFGRPVIADSIAGLAGPLAGVHAGLQWVKAHASDVRTVVTIASDTPIAVASLGKPLLGTNDVCTDTPLLDCVVELCSRTELSNCVEELRPATGHDAAPPAVLKR